MNVVQFLSLIPFLPKPLKGLSTTQLLRLLESLGEKGIGAPEIRQFRSHIISGGTPMEVDLDGGKIVTWEDSLGLCLHDGGYSPSARRINNHLIMLHWGGLDPEHCRRTLAERNYSSHIGIGKINKKIPRAYQWLDAELVAWHAGGVANRRSLGIDICQSPEVRFLETTRKRGYNVEVKRNPTHRGESLYVTLDGETADLTREVVFALCDFYKIPLVVPRDSDGNVIHDVIPFDPTFRGVLGHHHVSRSKWDIAPWWDQIFSGTALG